jgi:hypothetical protein
MFGGADSLYSNDTLRPWIRAGLSQRPRKVSFEDRETIVARYVAGDTLKAIGADYGVSDMTIIQYVERRGVAKRGSRRLALNQHAFDQPLTDDAAYWVGFLIADGCVQGRYLTLQLSAIDRKHVEKFRDFLGSAHKIMKISGNGRRPDQYRFAVSSLRITNALRELGVVERKTFSARASAPVSTNRHFWRGVVDGDGSIGWRARSRGRPQFCLQVAGSLPLMTQFRDYVRSITTSRANVYPNRRIYVFACTANVGKTVVRILYKDAPVALSRKLVIATQVF